jgi:trehalose-phosphatase
MRVLTPHADLTAFFASLKLARMRILILDYDGTLAPFQVRPERAKAYPRVIPLLDDIIDAERSRVVVVSGRRAADLVPLLDFRRRPEVWGAHGRERLLPDGELLRIEPDARARECLVQGEALARNLLCAGARVETKPGSVAFHWRGATALAAARIQEKLPGLWSEIAAGGGVEILPFDGGLELRALGCDKGHAVAAVLEEAAPAHVAAYLGDDLTDEDAFVAVKPHGLAVLVRAEMRATAADLWLRPPGELVLFLERWRSACAGAG